MHLMSSGNYSRLVASIGLTRNGNHYICQFYAPVCLLVVLSWIPLWLSTVKHQIRIMIALLITLALVILNLHFNSLFPVTSYMKWIDVYLWAGYLLILGSLAESVIVIFLEIQTTCKAFHSDAVPKPVNIVDKWTRWIVPIVWLSFNIYYIIRTHNMSYLWAEDAILHT